MSKNDTKKAVKKQAKKAKGSKVKEPIALLPLTRVDADAILNVYDIAGKAQGTDMVAIARAKVALHGMMQEAFKKADG